MLAEKLMFKRFVPLTEEQLERAWDDAEEIIEEGVALNEDMAMSACSLVPALVQEVVLVRNLRADISIAAARINQLEAENVELQQLRNRRIEDLEAQLTELRDRLEDDEVPPGPRPEGPMSFEEKLAAEVVEDLYRPIVETQARIVGLLDAATAALK